MNLYVIGSTGVIGSELFEKLKLSSHNVVGTYSKSEEIGKIKVDINESSDRNRLINIINKDDVVYLMAAYSNPSWIKQNQNEAKKLNLLSTINLIEKIADKGAKIVFMSSVEVFDGKKGGYIEEDKPNPLNLYGIMKYEVEKMLNTIENSVIVRTGWNVGREKFERCVIRLTYKSLLEKNARMAEDNEFSIVSTEDTSRSLIKIAEENFKGTIHIANDKKLKRTELADYIIKNSDRGSQMGYTKCMFKEIVYSEPRGLRNDLNNEKSKISIGVHYSENDEVIKNKIRLLDEQ